MRILLVNPWIADVSAYDFWLKPSGLLILGRFLAQSGHELRLIDCLDRYDRDLIAYTSKQVHSRWDGTGKFFHWTVSKPLFMKDIPRKFKFYGLPYSVVEAKLQTYRHDWQPEIVFVTSSMTYWYPGVWAMIDLVKRTFPSSKVFLGGIYPTLLPDHSAASGADERCTKADFLSVFAFLKEKGIFLQQPSPSLIPFYELYQHPMSHLVFLTSVGCPFHCTYCATPQIQPFFQQPVEELIDSMLFHSERLDCPNIAFFDDAILVNAEEHFNVILEHWIRSGAPNRGIALHIPNGIHARLLTKETAKLMKQANVKTIKIALETLDVTLQKTTGAKVSTAEFIRAIELLQHEGFTGTEIAAYLLINLPMQNKEDLYHATQLCEDLGIGMHFNEYTPIPATAEYKNCIDSGSIPSSLDPALLNNSLLPYWWKDGMDQETVSALKKLPWKTHEE